MRSKCQVPIDTCCRDTSCASNDTVLGIDVSKSVMNTVDACGEGKSADCASGLAKSLTGNAASVAACVSGQCTQACVGAPVAVPWSCARERIGANECETCIYESCGTALDTCCGDASCKQDSELLKDIQFCASGDAPGCAYLGDKSKSTSGYEGVVRACILKQCAAKCVGDGFPHRSCSLQSGGTACSCSDSQQSSGPACSAQAVGASSTCFLGSGGCRCGTYACSGTTSGCACALGAPTGNDACYRTGSDKCCLKLSQTGVSCACEFSSCGSNEFDIADCASATVFAELERADRKVNTCSR
jgi:hypothetical protein